MNEELEPATSYWTKRRKIVQCVNKIMEGVSYSDSMTETDVSTDQHVCPVSESAPEVELTTAVEEVLSTGSDPEGSPLHLPTYNLDDIRCPFAESDLSDISDSASSSEFSDDSECRLNDKLAKWALDFNISKDAVSALLHILNGYHPGLPLDSRTLLKTPDTSKSLIKNITGGCYYHFGIINGLKKLVDGGLVISSTGDDTKLIQLQINVDGLPVYKSTNYQLWPIVGMVVNASAKIPFVIGVFGGHKKPGDISEYLHDFVEECLTFEQSEIFLGSDVYAFKIHSILCDAPARAFVTNTKGHNAYYGCDRCVQSGVWLNKMTYPEVSATKRTDDGFRCKDNEEYHIGDTPLATLSIDLVLQLPLDYMHLVCLGVVRRLVLAWLKGPLECRLPAKSVCDISRKLEDFRLYMPSEFCRRPRPLSDIDRFKATEFRQLLLYTGVVAFRDIVSDKLYSHFMLLSCAIYCCLSPQLCHNYCAYAHELLVSFVQYAEKVYGAEFLVYNVHSLIHITDDVHNFGPLDSVSCFPFENYLRILKKSVRSSFLPFQQIIGRLSEQQHLKLSKVPKPAPFCSKEHCGGPLIDPYINWQQFRTVVMNDFKLSVSLKDSCVLTVDRSVGIVRNILRNNHEIMLVLVLFSDVQSLYTYPLQSSKIDVYSVSKLQSSLCIVPISQVCCKCVRLPLDSSRFAVIPLLHVA